MAETKKIVIDLEVNAEETKTSLKDLKREIKELRDIQLQYGESSEEYRKASQRIGELRDKLNDASDTARVLTGNVAENLTGAFSRVAGAGIGAFQAIEGAQAIFGEENKDLQKQMVKLQGLLNLSQGIKEFANIGQATKDFRTVLSALIPAIGAQTVATEGAAVAQTSLNTAMAANPIGAVVAALALLVGALVLFSDSTDESKKQLEELNKSEKKFNDSLKETNTTIDRRLKTIRDNLELSKLDGKDRELRAADIQKENALLDLQIQKQKEFGSVLAQLRLLNLKYIESKEDPEIVKDIVRQIDALKKEGVALLIKEKENEKLIVEQTEQDKLAIEKKYQTQSVKQVKDSQNEKGKIYQESAKQIAKQIDADSAYELESWARTGIARNQLTEQFNLTDEELNAAALQMREEEGFQQDAQIFEELLRRLQYKKDAAEEASKIDAESAAELEKWANQQVLTNEERAKKEAENEKILQQQKINAVQNGLSTIANLAQAFAGKSVKSQERAFKIQKAANIASAVIDTYQSATAAYKSLAGIPIVGPALGGFAAAAAVAAGLANIKRIKEQQFNASGTGGEGANVSTGGGGGVPTGAPPTGFNLPTAGIPTGVTPTPELLGTNQNINANNLGTPVTTVRAIVVESDITSAQIRIQNFETSAQLGNDE